MDWLIGQGRGDITVYTPGMVFLGFGNPKNATAKVDKALSSRAVWIESQDGGSFFIFVNLELCFITQSIVERVHQELQILLPERAIPLAALMITAQHTHAGPSSYTHYPIYNLPNGGFAPEVLEQVVKGCVEAILQAYRVRRAATLRLVKGRIPYSERLAYNRSLAAYSRNPEAGSGKIKKHVAHLAVDNRMWILEAADSRGIFAVLNWYGVHPTFLNWKNTHLSPGHKGYAADYVEKFYEKALGREDFVSIFAQGCCGDIAPDKRPWIGEHLLPGQQEKMLESSKRHGAKQAYWLKRLAKNRGTSVRADQIDSEIVYIDFSNIEIAHRYLPDDLKFRGIRTTPACLGVSFFRGVDNSGISAPLVSLAGALSKVVRTVELTAPKLWRWGKGSVENSEKVWEKYQSQGVKSIAVETGERRVMGTKKVERLLLPSFLDACVKNIKEFGRSQSMDEHSWSQQVLPVHLSIIGPLAIAGVPGEVTITAGQRLERELQMILKKRGVETVIISPYANAYCGYLTTPEEYDEQAYEGGHTVFGKWTLPAFQGQFAALAELMLLPKAERDTGKTSVAPPQFCQDKLAKRSYNLKDLATSSAII